MFQTWWTRSLTDGQSAEEASSRGFHLEA